MLRQMLRPIQQRRSLLLNFKSIQSLRSLFIQTQTTPNEHALKFLPSDTPILPSQQTPTIEINGIKEALNKSDLAFKLLSIDNKTITSILFGYNFITIVKNPQVNRNWGILKPEIFAILTEHLNTGQPILDPDYYGRLKQQELNKDDELIDEDEEQSYEDEVIELIQELLSTRIQPAIQEDGGDLKFVRFDFDTGTVYLKLIGACKSCSSSEITLKNGIEEMLKYYIDEVKYVKQLDSETGETQILETNDSSSAVNTTPHTHTHPANAYTSPKPVAEELPPSL